MYDRLRNRLDAGRQHGFTLIELLIVIVILGILAGIVVFAVGSATSDSKTSACRSEYKTIVTAQEAHKAKTGNYAASEAALVTAEFLKTESKNYDTGTANSGAVVLQTGTGANPNGCTAPPA